MHARTSFLRISCLVSVLASPALRGDESWKAGVARVKITPEKSLWMSGYGSRDRPSEGTLHDLWAKTLVIEDPSGERALLVSLDLVGIHRDTALSVCRKIREKYGLQRPQIALATSHTHTGPAVGRNLEAMLFLDDDDWKAVHAYASRLEDSIVDIAGQAIAALAPCRISWANGQAIFAVNRRNNSEKNVPALRKTGKLVGPVDYDVPVLAVRNADGTLRAAVFGYACHATVLSFYKWSGDYPGFAQIHLESAHPDATVLFFAGCGADQNPLPRRKVEQADGYGHRLAAAVDRMLDSSMTNVNGGITTRYAEIDLPFYELPTREQLEADTKSTNRYVARRATLLLERVRSGQPLSFTYPYPIQVWRLGADLTFVLLGGEVVVDYSLRIKKELGADSTWVAGYANDVMAYIPSLRVLREGGYEGADAMLYYGQPSRWAEPVEEMIITAVHKLARQGPAQR